MVKKLISLVKKGEPRISSMGGYMAGITPVFTDAPTDVIENDIVNNCIRKIANEISKLEPKHVRVDSQNGVEQEVNSTLNNLFKNGFNYYQTTPEFLEKLIWLREIKGNVFIYPTFEFTADGKRQCTAMHIINPIIVDFTEQDGKIYITMNFADAEKYVFDYADIIHIKKDYSLSDFMGGDITGNPYSRYLKTTLKSIHTAVEGVGLALKNSLNMRGVVNGVSLMGSESIKKSKKEFEDNLNAGKSGIIFLGVDQSYQQIHVNERLIAPTTLAVLENRVLSYFGVSQAILNGDFTENQYQAFYDGTLSSIQNHLSKTFTKVLFTPTEISFGNKVVFYSQKLAFSSMRTKLGVVGALAPLGVLTSNQMLEVFGYPPFKGGDVRLASLNYVDKEKMDNYQGVAPALQSDEVDELEDDEGGDED